MLKLGIVQFSAEEGNVEKNCRHLETLIRKYASEDIDLLCFPELCISGYDYKQAALSDGEEKFFSRLAAQYDIAIMAGIHMMQGGRHYDAACLWDNSGSLLGEYRKMHLWDTEYDFFTPGNELKMVTFKGWKIGLLICADFGFAEVSGALGRAGAEVILYPSAWAAGWEELFVTCGRIRAVENQVYTVALNRASGDKVYCGNTTVANPDGSILFQMDGSKEMYKRVVFEKEVIAGAKQSIPWQSMRRPEVYGEFKQ